VVEEEQVVEEAGNEKDIPLPYLFLTSASIMDL